MVRMPKQFDGLGADPVFAVKPSLVCQYIFRIVEHPRTSETGKGERGDSDVGGVRALYLLFTHSTGATPTPSLMAFAFLLRLLGRLLRFWNPIFLARRT